MSSGSDGRDYEDETERRGGTRREDTGEDEVVKRDE